MSAPFFEFGAFGESASFGVALIIGIAFGWFLERSGMGSARKLAGQFYLRDLTVFKVMFTAIVTAMLGAFWLGWMGVLDLSRVYVPETFILPQLEGGLIFGAGFAMGGLCPGTSCVSAATGRIDGFAVVIGMFAGVLVTGLFFAALFKFLPDARIQWREVLIGAVITAILFNVGQIVIGQYLGRTSVGSAYGAAGSLVVMLVWVYYSAAVFFIGAEITQSYATLFGSGIEAREKASPARP